MLTFALGNLAKGTFLLLLGVLLDRLWRRRGPDVRHAVLAVALIGALLVPLLSVALPAWRAAVPWLPPTPVSVTRANEDPALGTTRAVELAAAALRNDVRVAAPLRPVTHSSPFLFVSLLVWATGALCALVFLACGEIAMRRVRRRARRADSPLWTNLLHQAAAEVNAPPNVAVLLSSEIALPLACGLLRPAVLLPTDSERWSESRRRVVLVHELSHVRRHDAAIELAVWLACAAYWFHPLVWIVARRLRLQRELACDDSVVRATGDSLGYARHLVDIAAAARLQATRGTAALAMAARSSLEVRVRALLQARRPGRVTAGALVRLSLVGGAGIIALSVLHPTRAESRQLAAVPRDTLEWPIAPNAVVARDGTIRAGDTVSVRAAMGSIVIDSGPAGIVTFSARRRVGPRGANADTRVSVMRSGRTTMICSVHFDRGRRVAPCEVSADWGHGSVDDNDVSFRISVPAGVHIVLMSGLGDLTTMRTHADVRALTGNGDATIETDGAADVEAYTGRIDMRVLPGGRPAPVSLRVKHGGIDVALPPNEGATITATADSGSVSVVADSMRTREPVRALTARIGDGRRRLDAALQKGAIRIGVSR